MVKIRNLKKKYGAFSVLNGLNMDVFDGDVYGFLGRNGCGKTTTMNIICDIIPKDEGTIELGGGNPISIGYLPESPMIFDYMTAREYLRYIAACCNYPESHEKRVDEVLEIIGLTQAADRRTKGFSRGMTQRLGMGAAIFAKPQLLMFDEPTSALDPQGRADVIAIINRLKNMGSTIVLSTHILSDVERVANRIGIVRGGIIAEEGGLTELLQKHGGSVITLKARNLTQEQKIALLSIDFAKAEFNNDTGIFRFGMRESGNAAAEECSRRLMQLMCENAITAESFNITTATLEEIFGKVAG